MVLSTVLQFSCILLENCANRNIYASGHQLYCLLNIISLPVLCNAAKTCMNVAQRYAQTRSSKFSAGSAERRKLFHLAAIFPHALFDPADNKTFSLIDFITKPLSYFPSRFSTFEFQYFKILKLPNTPSTATPGGSHSKHNKNSQSQTTPSRNNNHKVEFNKTEFQHGTSKVSHNKLHHQLEEGISTITFSSKDLQTRSLDSLISEICKTIQKDDYYEAALKLLIAKCFQPDSPLEMRTNLLTLKCLSVGFTGCVSNPTSLHSKIIDLEPSLLQHLVELIHPDNKADMSLRIAALKVFECIGLWRSWSTDILKALSGNVNHGTLSYIIRHIIKGIKDDDDVNEEFNVVLFAVIHNLLNTQGVAQLLTSGGLLGLLMQFMSLKTPYRRTIAAAVQLNDLLLTSVPNNLNPFIEADGFNILIKLICDEVEIGISDDSVNSPPDYCVVSYTISYRQSVVLKSLMKFVLHLIMSNNGGDRMRNLFDSPLLTAMNKIILNPKTFGTAIITCTLNTITLIIHNEPTSFPILSEAKTIDTVLKQFESLFNVSSDLLVALPDVIGAISLNNDGLKKIKDLNILHSYFKIFLNPAYCKELAESEMSSGLGTAFDELVRHFTDFAEPVLKEIETLLNVLPKMVGESFKGIVFNTSGDINGKSPTWKSKDTNYLIENFSLFLSGLLQSTQFCKTFIEKSDVKTWFDLFKMSKAPYDYIQTNAYQTLVSIGRDLSEIKTPAIIEATFDELITTLDNLKDFIEYDGIIPYLDSNSHIGSKTLENINTFNLIFYAALEMFFDPRIPTNPGKLSQLTELLSRPRYQNLIEVLGKYFTRVVLEESLLFEVTERSLFIKSNPPKDDDLTVLSDIISCSKLDDDSNNKDDIKEDNNLKVSRFLFSKSIYLISKGFLGLNRISLGRRYELSYNFRKVGVRVGESIAQAMTSSLKTVTDLNDLVQIRKLLILLASLQFMFLAKARPMDQLQTVFAICFVEKGGFIRLKEIIHELVDSTGFTNPDILTSLSGGSIADAIATDNIHECQYCCVHQIIFLFSKMVIKEVIAEIHHGDCLYPRKRGDAASTVPPNKPSANFLIYIRIFAFNIIKKFLDHESFSKFPTPLVTGVIEIIKYAYGGIGENQNLNIHERLRPLLWERIPPSEDKIRYMLDIGVTDEKQIREALWRHNDQLDVAVNTFSGANPEIKEKFDLNPYTALELPNLPPAYKGTIPPSSTEKDYYTLEDLRTLRQIENQSIIVSLVTCVQDKNAVVHEVAEVLFHVSQKKSHLTDYYCDEVDEFDEEVMKVILGLIIRAFELDPIDAQDSKISGLYHLIGLVSQRENIILRCRETLGNLIDFSLAIFTEENAHKIWFPKALLLIERLLSASIAPKVEAPSVDVISSSSLPKVVPSVKFTDEKKETLFSFILKIEDLNTEELAIAVARLLVLFGKDSSYAARTIHAPVMRGLLKSVEKYSGSKDCEKLSAATLILLRYNMENHDMIKTYISAEVNSEFTPNRPRDLNTLLKKHYPLVLRSPSIFIEVSKETLRLDNCTTPINDFTVRAVPPKTEKDEESGTTEPKDDTKGDISMTDALTGQELDLTVVKSFNSSVSNKSTGAMNLLLSELVSIKRADILADAPTENTSEDESKNNHKSSSKFYYACFLLQTIIELLSSYKESKLEFLIFSRKPLFSLQYKARPVALNYIIYQLLPTESLIESSGIQYERKCTLSILSKLVILSLISTIVTPEYDPSKKIEDELCASTRRLTADTIVKAMKDAHNSTDTTEKKYSKLIDLADLIESLFSTRSRSVLGNCLDTDVTSNDPYHIAKSFIDRGATNILTSLFSDLDLNYPNSKRIIKSILRPLNLISSVRSEQSELFEKENPKNEDEDEAGSDGTDEFGSDTPDIFKNSSLGMYDVDEALYDEENEDMGSVAEEEMDYDEEEDEDDDELQSDISDDIEEEEEGYLDEHDTGSFGHSSDDDEHISVELIGEEISDEDMDTESDDSEHMDDDDTYDRESDWESIDEEDEEGEDHGPDNFEEIMQEYDNSLDEDAPSISESGSELSDANYIDIDDELGNEAIDFFRDGEMSDDDSASGRFSGIIRDESRNLSSNPLLVRPIEMERRPSQYRRPEFLMERSNDTIGVYGASSGLNESASLLSDIVRQVTLQMHPGSRVNLNLNNRDYPSVRQIERMLGRSDRFRDSRTNQVSGHHPSNSFRFMSVVERWDETARMFAIASHEEDAKRLAASVLNAIYEPSLELEKIRKEKAEKLLREREKELEEKRKREEEKKREREEQERREREAREEAAAAENAINEAVTDAQAPTGDHVFVRIGDRDVDVGGMGIDPTFLEALPEDMREEVFSQHVREQRAAAQTTGESNREIDPEFLQALPESIRNEVLAQEEMVRRQEELGQQEESDEGAEGTEQMHTRIIPPFGNIPGMLIRQIRAGNEVPAGEMPITTNKESKKKNFTLPLVERNGIASLIRLLFLPQPWNKREHLYDLLYILSYNKQTRVEILNIMMSILQDGMFDQHSLERAFVQTSGRAKALPPQANKNTPRTPNTPLKFKESSYQQFPSETSRATVGKQIIEALQSLLFSDSHIRYYFLCEHEYPIGFKKQNKSKSKSKEVSKENKFPINALISLLESPVVHENSTLIERVTRVLQAVSRPLTCWKKEFHDKDKKELDTKTSSDTPMRTEGENKADVEMTTPSGKGKEIEKSVEKSSEGKKTANPPIIPDHNLQVIVSVLTADDCTSQSFQQTLTTMQNLSVVPNARRLFPIELGEQASVIGKRIVNDLNDLVSEIKQTPLGDDIRGTTLSKFSPASSDQAKLLRVLTALDYLFDSKKKNGKEYQEFKDSPKLTQVYESLALGPLWGALSGCLRLVQDRTDLNHVATVLLPLMEALMVVCKHSKVKELPIREVMKYEAKKHDFSNEPIENLFFSFTDEHKKILNQMVRNSPKLMSGPFSLLARNLKVLEFDNKRNFFNRKLHTKNDNIPTLKLNVRRESIFLDSYKSMFFKTPDEIKYAKLDINFRGEAGVDAGGVTREWFQVLSRQMFNPDYALFTPVASDKTTFHPNRTSWANPEHLSFFKFIGRIIGKAIYDGKFLDCHFSRAVYKRILGKSVSLKDMETLDLEYYKSLLWMLENDITDIITETFSVETDDYGEVKIKDLIPNGRNIPVTEENKQEYVRLVTEYRLQSSVMEQMDHFLSGFHDIIPKDLIAIFDEQELELLISGLPDIDVDDWRNNSEYNNYSPASPQIQWFWRAVKSFDTEERAKLLQFATGTSKVPLNGFKELGGVNGISKFSIHRDYGSKDRLPSSHTCFNQIDLPEYDTYETLRGSLLLAITEGHIGFGLA